MSRSCLPSGLDLSYESVRSWVLKFAPAIARGLRRGRPRPSDRWHLDEMVVRIAGQHMYLSRAVDHEGEVLDILVQRRRDRSAAVKLMRKLLRKQGFAPTRVTTDKLRSYGAAFRHLGLSCHHEQGLRENNRAENSRTVSTTLPGEEVSSKSSNIASSRWEMPIAWRCGATDFLVLEQPPQRRRRRIRDVTLISIPSETARLSATATGQF